MIYFLKSSLVIISLFFLCPLNQSARASESPWHMLMHDPQHTGCSINVGPVTPELLWKFKAGGYIRSSPVISSDGSIYVDSYDDYLYAIDSDGNLKWMEKLWFWSSYNYTPAIGNDGAIYYYSYGRFYSYDYEGNQNWEIDYIAASKSPPTIGEDGNIYLGDASPYDEGYGLYVLDPDGSLLWTFKTDTCVESSPSISLDGTIYVTSFDNNNGHLFSINPNRTENWRFKIDGGSTSTPSIGQDGTIYFSSENDVLYAINPDGSKKWQFDDGVLLHSTQSIGPNGTIYIGSSVDYYTTDYAHLYALDSSGNLKWTLNLPNHIRTSIAIDANGTLFFGSHDNNVYAINPDGSFKWTYKTGQSIYSSPAIGSDGTIYIGSDDDHLYALGTDKNPPDVAFIYPQNGSYVNSGDIHLKIAAQDSSGVRSVEYQLDNGKYHPCLFNGEFWEATCNISIQYRGKEVQLVAKATDNSSSSNVGHSEPLIINVLNNELNNEYWVDSKAQNENGDGSIEKPFKTLSSAVENLTGYELRPVTIRLKPGTYNRQLGERFPIKLKKYMNVVGKSRDSVIIDPTGSDNTAFLINFIDNLTIESLSIKGGAGEKTSEGREGGGIYSRSSTFSMLNCYIEENNADLGGGAAFVDSEVYIDGCDFNYNKARGDGGGVFCLYSELNMVNCRLEYNLCKSDTGKGGGIYSTNSTLNFDEVDINYNKAGSGGGLELISTGGRFKKCEFNNNEALENGGGISCSEFSSPLFKICTIKNNSTINEDGTGGGVCSSASAEPAFEDCYIRENSSVIGGGFYCNNSSPIIYGCYISGNKGEFFGGGFLIESNASISVRKSKIENNSAWWAGGLGIWDSSYSNIVDCEITYNEASKGVGGGLCIWEFSKTNITNCVIAENKASEKGGGIYSSSSNINIINCLVVENESQWEGGGIFESGFFNSSFLFNCTIANNISESSSGIKFNNAGKSLITNSIVWGNEFNGDPEINNSDIKGGYDGSGNIDEDPLFVNGPWGNYYLSQIASGQKINSPCINKGISRLTSDFSPKTSTNRTDGFFDMDLMDMGYHYPPNIIINLELERNYVKENDQIEISYDLKTPHKPITADIYFFMVTPDGLIYSAGDWNNVFTYLVRGAVFPSDMLINNRNLMSLTLPNIKPPIFGEGTYTFYIFATQTGKMSLISNVSSVSFFYEKN